MSRRLDRRRVVIPAVLVGTLALGFAAQRLGQDLADRRPAVADPHIRSAVVRQRDDAALHQSFQQAVALLQSGRYEFAVKGFHDVLRVAPEMPEAHVNMGFALLGLEKYAEARDFFEAATSLRPAQVNAYYGNAIAQEGLGELRQAVALMRTFAHLVDDNDPFRRKAEAAIWEWEAALADAEQ